MLIRKNTLAGFLPSMTQPEVSALAPGSFICGDELGHLFFLPNIPLTASARMVVRISAMLTWSTGDDDDDGDSEIDNDN